jgi:hypothetical protein
MPQQIALYHWAKGLIWFLPLQHTSRATLGLLITEMAVYLPSLTFSAQKYALSLRILLIFPTLAIAYMTMQRTLE